MTFLVGNRLRDMIRAIRACKTAAEERAVVARECAALRDLLKEPTQHHRHRNVAKLMFIHMLGYPTHFGQMECMKLIAEGDFPEKRIGYLGLMVLLDERQEVLMLVTNSIKNDLHHTNQHVAGLALCALGNICTAEMARELSAEVERLLHGNNAYIRKKAALCAIRIVRKVPDFIESYKGPALNLLMDKHHGVLVAGVELCIELCLASDAALEHFRKQVSTIVRLLKSLVLSGYAPEYDVTGISDPLLQIKLLRLLRLIGKGDSDSSDVMSDVLAQVATNTEGTKNAGRAILYECVLTIMAIEDIGALRVLAINILGRFLANIDNNIRYVALNTLVKAIAVDNQAVQRHRKIIVNCVKVCSNEALVYRSNYLNNGGGSPYVRMVYWLLPCQAGIYVKEEERLAQVTVWCIGEYGDMLVNNSNELEGEDPQTVTESDAVDVVESVLRDHRVGPTTIAFCLTALLKLTSRFPQCTKRIQALLEEYSRHVVLELQQRSSEFGSILSRHSNLKGPLLERMPVLDLASYSEKHAGIDSKYEHRSVSPVDRIPTRDPASTELTTNHLMDMLTIQPEDPPPALSASADNAVLNLIATSALSSTPVRYSVGGASALLDILAVGEQTESTSVPQTSTSSAVSRRLSTLEELLSNPLPDHRLSILELEPQCLHGTPLDKDISLTADDRTSLVESSTLSSSQRSSSSLAFELLDEMPLTSSSRREPTTSQQRVYPEPTLAQQKRVSMNDALMQKRVSLNDARLQSRQGSYTEPSTTAPPRRSFLLVEALKSRDIPADETWPTPAQQRKIKEDSASRISRLSFHSGTTPAQALPIDEPPEAGSLISVPINQSKDSGAPVVDIWPKAAKQREIKEDSALRISRLSLHAGTAPAQMRTSFPLDKLTPATSTRIYIHDNNQLKVFPEKRMPLLDNDVPLNVPSIVALQTQGLKVDFEFTKTPELPQTTVIKALFSNTSSTPYTDFIFQAAVPKVYSGAIVYFSYSWKCCLLKVSYYEKWKFVTKNCEILS